MSTEDFKASQKFVMRFGIHEGKTLDKIAETDDGLLYLDSLRGKDWLRPELSRHLTNYLSDPTIKKELDAIT